MYILDATTHYGLNRYMMYCGASQREIAQKNAGRISILFFLRTALFVEPRFRDKRTT